MEPSMPRGFTLIELLVVVTIIVVLLALLTPALDQAIYQAELAVCGTNLKNIGLGMQNYALQHRRSYPHRQSVHIDNFPAAVVSRGGNVPGTGALPTERDDRPLFTGYIDLNGHGNCPLTGEIDIANSQPTTVVFLAYDLWAGFRYVDDRGMLRLGDRLDFTVPGTTRTYSYDLLAGDGNIFNRNDPGSTHNGHPDADGIAFNQVSQDSNADGLLGNPSTRTRWLSYVTQQRGTVELQFVNTDGSVDRYNRVEWDDPRFNEPMEGPSYFANKGAPEWEHRLPLR